MIIGINGKIASGKTEVLRVFEEYGFFVIDADKIVHSLYANNKAGVTIVSKLFGNEYIGKNGSVKRHILRELVFNDLIKLRKLNKAIHPLVYEQIKKRINSIQNKNIAIEAAYFDKEGLKNLTDRIIWVKRSKKDILDELVNIRRFDKKVAENAFKLIKKPVYADFTINNDGDIKKLKKQVEAFLGNNDLLIN